MTDKRTRFYRILYSIAGPVIRFLFRIRIIGGENEPAENGIIVCANHFSASDPIILNASLRYHQVCFMAKKELFRIPVLSWLIRKLGAYPVDRSGADVGAIRHAIRLVGDGFTIGIFPQGTRCPGVNPRDTKVKGGAAMIASHTDAPIMPVHIYRKDYRPRLFRKTVVTIGKPIPFSEFSYDREKGGEYVRIANEIFDRICTAGEETEKTLCK